MITREQYLEALAIIDEYHYQNIKLKRDFYKDLQVGDFIVFEKVKSKYLTVGKKYKVVKIDDGWRDGFMFYDDRNKFKHLRKCAKGYQITLV